MHFTLGANFGMVPLMRGGSSESIEALRLRT
jgi:hypothetical protein